MTSPPVASEPAAAAEPKWQLPPIRGLVTLLAGEGLSRVFSFLAIALLTRRLGPAGWAPVAVALTAVQFGALVVESGMRLYGAREVARDGAAAGRLLPPVLATQVVVAALIAALGVVAWWGELVDPDLGRLLPGYALSLLALPFFVPWVFQGHGEMQWVAVPQVVRFGAFLILSAAIVVAPERANLLPWIEVAAMGIGAAVAVVALRRYDARVTFDLSRAFDREVMREAIPIAGSQVLWVLRMYLPTLVLWKLAARESVAHFDVAHRVLMVIQALQSVYLANLLTPLSRAGKESRQRFFSLLLAATALAGVAAAAGAVVLAAIPGPILGLLNGAEFNNPEAAAALTILSLVIVVIVVRGHAHYALVAAGYQRRELACAFVSTTVLAGLLVWWVPSGGSGGAALAMLVAESVGLVITWAALWHAGRGRGFASAEGTGETAPSA